MRSYASLILFMRSAAAASFGFRSGWFSRAFLRYAFFTSSSEASRLTPNTS